MEKHFSGTSASNGLQIGRAFVIQNVGDNMRQKLGPIDERTALLTAISSALATMTTLMKTVSGSEADIIGVQNALLGDEALTEAVWPQIEAGVSAHDAWQNAMDCEIAGFLASDDEHIRARSADFIDIRNRVSAHLFGNSKPLSLQGGEIIIADDIAPSMLIEINWSKGGAIVLGAGSTTSHAAMLARAKSIPMVVGIGPIWKKLRGTIIVDGDKGIVIANPAPGSASRLAAKIGSHSPPHWQIGAAQNGRLTTIDGTYISILLNVATPEDLASFDVVGCDGIGLVRTEFLAMGAIFDEEAQFRCYIELLKWAKGRPVTIRTIDAGGDKPVDGYSETGETNPFLGMRGIRLSLLNLDVFKIQLRAILRAAALGPLRIMLPMTTRPTDVEGARATISASKLELLGAGVAYGDCELGIMVEVPAVAMCPEVFEVDFYSIGSNDLTQFATAASRDNNRVADYADTAHPGVLAMIKHVTDYGLSFGKQVSLCGDAGSDPRYIHEMLKAGVRVFSVPPGAVASTKAIIRSINLAKGG